MALQLPDDGGSGERRELQPAIRLEALHRLQEAHERDLPEIIEWFSAVGEATGEELGEPHVLLDQRVAQVAVARTAVLLEPLARRVVAVALRRLAELGRGALHRRSASTRRVCFTTENVITPSRLCTS